MIHFPEDKSSQVDRVRIFPSMIYFINEIVHKRLDAMLRWWLIFRFSVADFHFTRTEFARVCVQTSDGMKIKSFDHVLRQESPVCCYRSDYN